MTRIKVPVTEDGAAAGDYAHAGAVVLPLRDVETLDWLRERDPAALATATEVESLDGIAHNLPVQLTSFVGRHAEMAQVRALLSDSRMVTLTGAGGVGKTRLALQVAASVLPEFPAGVWLVDLAPLTDPALVSVTVARALGLVDSPGRSTMAMVTGFLRERRALVVLDNCEHLLDASAGLVEELLRACSGLVILATSREPIGVTGEASWLVPSLQLAGEAVELFADRGRQARPGFEVTAENAEAVAEICRRLDGIPLAIELAAARLRAFSPAEIAAGLHDRFRLLTGGSRTAARRQQTLRASVDWSHALLSGPERVVFRRLAAFPSGFDLPAAQAVAMGDGVRPDEVPSLVALLVDKSLVAADQSEVATKYRLPETIRQYAAEKLADSGEADRARTRHRDHYVALACLLDRQGAHEARRLVRRMETDMGNLRAAFQWSLELSDCETALRLASSLQPLWLSRARVLEGLAWFDAALNVQTPGAGPVTPEVRVQATADAAVLDAYGNTPGRMAQAEDAVAEARQLGDPALLARALLGAGSIADLVAEARRRYLAEANALARQAGDAWTLAQILAGQALTGFASGEFGAPRSAAEEGLALAEKTGNDVAARACRLWLGYALFTHGDLHRARSLFSDVIADAEADRLPWWKALGLGWLGYALAYIGEADAARQAGQASIAIADDLGLDLAVPGHGALALAAMACGDADALRDAIRTLGQRLPDLGFSSYLAEAHLAAGDLSAARQYADQTLARAARLGAKSHLMLALQASARVAAAAGAIELANDDTCHALAIARDMESQLNVIDVLECLGGIARDPEDMQKAARLLGAADALRQRTGYQRFLLRQPGYDASVLKLRSSLGEQAFSQAWDEGAALTLDDAVRYALRGRGERNRPAVGWLSLTPAEREVARLVADGRPNKEIALQLFVSPRTVQTHLTHIYGKLGITSRVQLAQQASRHATDS